MSNTRHLLEMNGGRLTRPRATWAGRARGRRAVVQAPPPMLAGVLSALARTRLPLYPRRGDR